MHTMFKWCKHDYSLRLRRIVLKLDCIIAQKPSDSNSHLLMIEKRRGYISILFNRSANSIFAGRFSSGDEMQ